MQLNDAMEMIPPQALGAEQALLGSVLIGGPSVLDTAREALSPEDFYRRGNRLIFEACCNLADRGQPTDIRMVFEELQRVGTSDEAGGLPFLAACLEAVPAVSHAEGYASHIVEASLRRRMHGLLSTVAGRAWRREGEVEELIAEIELAASSLRRIDTGGLQHIRGTLAQVWEEIGRAAENPGHLLGLPSGFERLDEMTGGFQKSDLIIVAGRPSMGKTALALNCAMCAARSADHPIAVFSLEMSARSLAYRLLAEHTEIDSARLRGGWLRSDSGSGDQWSAVLAAVGELSRVPVYLDATPGLPIAALRQRARRLQREHGLSLVVVDYLQLLYGGKHESRYQEVSYIARTLKHLARELDCPVMALSQLSRLVERRDKKRPVLSDLLESGGIEAEADLVLMLYRPAYYDHGEDGGHEGNEEGERAELIVAKHRNGPTGTVPLLFVKRYGYFRSAP